MSIYAAVRSLFTGSLAVVFGCGSLHGAPTGAGEVHWRYELPGAVIQGVAEAPTGTVYVAAGIPGAPTAGRPGRLVALSATGEVEWSVDLGRPPASRALVVAGERVVVLDALGTLTAYDRTGTGLWTLGNLRSRPAVDAEGNLYALQRDGATAAVSWGPDGQRRWRFEEVPTEAVIEPLRGPVVSGGVVAFEDGGVRLRGRDGRGFWGNPPVAPGRGILIGLEDGDFLRSGAGLDWIRSDGSVRWRREETPTAGPVVAADGRIVVGLAPDRVVGLGDRGEEAWTRGLGVPVIGPMAAAADGSVYAITEDAQVRRILPQAGEGEWTFDLGAPSAGTLILSRTGDVLVGTQAGVLWCLRGGSLPAASAWPMDRGDPGNTGAMAPGGAGDLKAPSGLRLVTAPAPGILGIAWESVPGARGYEVWRGTNTLVPEAQRLAGDVAVETRFDDDAAPGGAANVYWVRAYDERGMGPLGGPVIGVQAHREWTVAFPGFLQVPVGLREGRVAVVHGPGAGTAGLVVLERDGREAWRRDLDGVPVVRPAARDDGRIVVATARNDAVTCFEPEGGTVWSVSLQESPGGALAVDAAHTVYVLGGVARLNLWAITADGRLAWTVDLGESLVRAHDHPTLMEDGTVVVGSDLGLAAVLPSGIVAWRIAGEDADAGWSPASVGGDGLAWVMEARGGRIPVRAEGAGEARHAPDEASRVSHAPVITREGGWGVLDDAGRLRVHRPDGSLARSAPTQADGQTPALSVDGRFWFVEGGRVCVLDLDGGITTTAGMVGGRYFDSPVLTAEGRLYLVDSRNRLHALPAAPLDTAAPWPMYRGGPAGNGRRSVAVPGPPWLSLERTGAAGGLRVRFGAAGPGPVILEASEDLRTWNVWPNNVVTMEGQVLEGPTVAPGGRWFLRARRP